MLLVSHYLMLYRLISYLKKKNKLIYVPVIQIIGLDEGKYRGYTCIRYRESQLWTTINPPIVKLCS